MSRLLRLLALCLLLSVAFAQDLDVDVEGSATISEEPEEAEAAAAQPATLTQVEPGQTVTLTQQVQPEYTETVFVQPATTAIAEPILIGGDLRATVAVDVYETRVGVTHTIPIPVPQSVTEIQYNTEVVRETEHVDVQQTLTEVIPPQTVTATNVNEVVLTETAHIQVPGETITQVQQENVFVTEVVHLTNTEYVGVTLVATPQDVVNVVDQRGATVVVQETLNPEADATVTVAGTPGDTVSAIILPTQQQAVAQPAPADDDDAASATTLSALVALSGLAFLLA